MSSALLGILVLQFFWINNVHQLTEDQFTRDVSSSLDQTAKDLEHVEALKLIDSDTYNQGLQGSLTDFVRSEFGEVMAAKEAIHVRDTIIMENGERNRFLIVEGSTIDTATGLRAESRIITKNLGEFQSSNLEENTLHLDTNSFAIRLNQSFERQIFNKAQHLNEMIVKMFAGNYFDNLDLRLDLFILDSLLSRNLYYHSLDTTFTYNIVDLAGKPVPMTQKSKRFNPGLKEATYSTLLYPNDVLPGEYKLVVNFPNQNLFVWKSMIGTLIGSLILIILVFFAFFFAVRTIYRQKQLSEIKNDFISNMTHELKTPISTISLACEALKDPDINTSEENSNGFITMISQENKRLEKLVENVLETALLEKGKLKLNLQETNIGELIKDVVDAFQIRFKDRGGKIIINRMDAVVWDVDRIHFGNIIYNLLDNSLKYCDTSPIVEVNLMKKDDGFFVEVADNGIGIKKEDQKRIFDKLFRVSTGDVHNVKGFGLGLSYVNSIVNLHKGIIDLKSALGKGSTFKIIIES